MNYLAEVFGAGGISAKMVADSISDDGVRLSTMEIKYHRFIHAEFMTHRMFSRNASSSRAIPVSKMLKSISLEPAFPIHWGANEPGMKATKEHNDKVWASPDCVTSKDWISRDGAWATAADHAVDIAGEFAQAGYHKQIVNRLTEPFQFITVVVTATEWDNFFDLRLHKDAQPEIHELARVMKEVMVGSYPLPVGNSDRHLPYITTKEQGILSLENATKCSVARCARVSYLNHDKASPSLNDDIKLHDMLLKSKHMSPFEHIAWPIENIHEIDKGVTHITTCTKPEYWSGNFRGWVQYRNIL